MRSRCKECPCSSAAKRRALPDAASRHPEEGEPVAGKKRKRQDAAGSGDAKGMSRSSGKEPADEEEAFASSGADGECRSGSDAGVVDDRREDEEEAFERELDALIRQEAERM